MKTHVLGGVVEVLGKLQRTRKTAIAIFFAVIFIAGTVSPTASAIAEAAESDTSFKYAGPLASKSSQVDVLSQTKLAATDGSASKQLKQLTQKSDKPLERTELEDKRTANKEVFRNTDGSITEKHYFGPKFYKKDNKWETINSKLSEDKNAGDSKNIFGRALGAVESVFAGEQAFTTNGNDWQARFAVSNDKVGMVRIVYKNQTVAFSPVNANDVAPVITTKKDGSQILHYYDLWNDVDVEYYVDASQVKQNIIIKNAKAAQNFGFTVSGAKLIEDTKNKGTYKIDGALGNEFATTPLNLMLNNFGQETKDVLEQSYKNNTLSVSVDSAYVNKLPKKAFPIVIDPGFARSFYGTRGGGNYVSFKTDGTICNSQTCNTQAGTLYDQWGYLQYWRSAFFAPYDFARTNEIRTANLHLTQRSNESFWTGTWDAHNFQIGHATCLNNFHCVDGVWASATFGGVGDINVTNLYQSMAAAGDFGGWLMIMGEDGTASSYKNFDPNNSFVDFTYNYHPGTPTPELPSTNPNSEVVVTTQTPQLQVSSVGDADGDAVNYRFLVQTNTGVTVWDTGANPTRQWIIPDGLLEDGTSYVWQYAVSDPYWTSQFTKGGSFRVDLRTGKDKTQTYDTVGPASVSLSNGNLFTDVSTHSLSALGGNIGLSLNYNTPVMSRRGLTAEYFNGQNWGSTANYRRTEPNINTTWDLGTPVPGIITNDNFSARWSGYFVAPYSGSYNFGGNHDDYLAVTVNGQQVYTNGGCYTGVCYGNAITLAAGQVVTFQADYIEATGPAYARLYVKGPVSERVVPQDWFRTAAYATSQNSGLTGTYYYDDGSHDVTKFANNKFMVRTDPSVNFNWGTSAPVPGAPQDGFYVRWDGYYKVPTTGNYFFGAGGDDGYRLKVNNQDITNNWAPHGYLESYAAAPLALTGGTMVPITLEYFESGGPGSVKLLLDGPSGKGVIEPQFLVPGAKVLPAGWSISVDADGDLAYDRLAVRQNGDVMLFESDGTEHLYTNTGSGYKPPVNEDATLAKNADGTFQLVDDDGRIYVFNIDGTLKETSSPTDSRKPAALKYVYATQNGVPKLSQINDGVDPSRNGKVYYQDDAQCAGKSGMPSVPSGFDSAPPIGNICAFITSDGSRTDIFYKNGTLARVVAPGSEIYDMAYDTNGIVTSIRDVAANDAVAAGIRTADASVTTEITYDVLARAQSLMAPAAKAGDVRVTDSIEYRVSSTRRHVSSANEPNGYSQYIEYDNLQRTTKACDVQALCTETEWDTQKDLELSTVDAIGLKTITKYDSNNLPVESFGPAPKEWFNTWSSKVEPEKYLTPGQSIKSRDGRFTFAFQQDSNLVLSGPSGILWSSGTGGQNGAYLIMQSNGDLVLYSQTSILWRTGTQGDESSFLTIQNDGNLVIYDSQGTRAVWNTGTAVGATATVTAADYDKPLPEYLRYIPHTQTAYDEGIIGSAVSWYDYSRQAGNPAGVLFGAPKLYTTGITPSNPGLMSGDLTQPPITASSGMQGTGLRATGKLRLPTGKYWINADTSDGVRVWVDDVLVVDAWVDSAFRTVTGGSFTVSDSTPKRLRVDTYRKTGSTGAFNVLLRQENGFGWTNTWSSWLKPDYNLATSTKVLDSDTGDVTTTTNYGTNPEFGLVQSVTEDSGGLNLTTSLGYESPGTGYLRQTSKTLPGGNKYTYTHYGATETRANPCVSGSPAVSQAGFVKGKAEPDPDGTGAQTARTQETVYDSSGRVVASRYNADGWTCTTYDTRGRVTKTVVPTINTRVGRTITNNYAVGGNPLITSTGDSSGTVTVENDLLGRNVKYTDAKNNVTTSTYDDQGHLIGRSSLLGAESFVYDQFDRLVDQKLDNVVLAHIYYDAYSRIDTITYPAAGQQKVHIGRDDQGRLNLLSYVVNNGATNIYDNANRSASGDVTFGTENGKNKTYTYDKAGRLTKAVLGTNTFDYSYGTPSATTCNQAAANLAANKNGNRTSMAINGATITYCYDQADRLISSSDPKLTAPAYDDHGNTKNIGSGTNNVTSFTYDASDRNTKVTEGSNSTTYTRDVQSRIINRSSTIGGTSYVSNYGYSGASDTPDFLKNSGGTVTEKYLQLPGNILLTIRPSATGEAKNTYSLPNIHGDVMATTTTSGTLSGTFATGPFGEKLASPTPVAGQPVNPNNTGNKATFNYVGQHEKFTEDSFSIAPVQMGARVYIASLGRFLQVDPVEGGTDNSYVYPGDPVSESDLTGLCPVCVVLGVVAVRVVVQVAVKQIAKQTVKQAVKQEAKRGVPRDFAQKLAAKEAAGKAGTKIPLKGGVKDPKYSGGNWEKRGYVHRGLDGRKIDIHWMQNLKTSQRSQVKIKFDSKYNNKKGTKR